MNNHLFFSLFTFITLSQIYGWDVGTDIDEILESRDFKFSQPTCPPVPAFKDIELVSLSQINEFTKSPIVLAAKQNNEYIAAYGILDGIPPNAYYLYDTDGDGILDFKTNNLKYITWIYYNANLLRTDISSFSYDCQLLYNEFNSINGPDKMKITQIYNKFTNIVLNSKTNNLDLYYSLLFYSSNFTKDPKLCLGTLISTRKYLSIKYNQDIPLILLSLGETYVNLHDYENAKIMFSTLTQIDQNSLIAYFYLARIELLKNKNKQLIDNFKKEHSNFWKLR